MINYLIISVVAFGATILFLPLAKILGRRMNIWDHPDELGMHTNSTPRSGGIAMAFAIWLTLQICGLLPNLPLENRKLAAMALGTLGFFGIGLMDDLREIKPHTKAIGLFAAALAITLVSRHFSITGFERLDFIFSILVLIAGANALNFLDGMDGLASGVTAIASLGFFITGLLFGDIVLACWGAIVIGATLGFLTRNRPPASIFMGDCGSLMLGGILGWMFLILATYGPSGITAAAILVSWLVLDAGLAIIRRLILHRDIFTGDRRHVYDMMYIKFKSVRKVDATVYSIQGCFVLLAVAARFLPWHLPAAVTLIAWLGIIWWMIRLGMFAPAEPTGRSIGHTILVVDDDPAIVHIVKEALNMSGKGYDIRIAVDGFAAGRELSLRQPNLVILDIKLPGADGFEVCRQIKALDKNIKVIAITGFDTEENRRKMKEAGAEAFLAKPFKMDTLLAKTEELLG